MQLNRFLTNIIRFLMIVFVSLLVWDGLSKYAVRHFCSYEMEKKYEAIILGHSQTEHALDDQYLPGVKNLCNGGEAYLYTYQKLKLITAANPQIKTVYLSVAPNQLTAKLDEWAIDTKNVNSYFSKYAFMMEVSDYQLVASHNFEALLNAEIVAIKNNAKAAVKRQNRVSNGDLGGYMAAQVSKLDSLEQQHHLDKEDFQQFTKPSVINLAYLKKIVAYCHQHSIQLVFVKMPVYARYNSRINQSVYHSLLKENFPNQKLWDFQQVVLDKNDFRDYTHLNSSGAKKVSRIFAQRMLHSKI